MTGNKARLISNFIRMGLNLIIGLLLVRLILSIGQDSFSLYILMVAGFGLGALAREVLRVSMIAHLGKALANGQIEDPSFRESLGQVFVFAFGFAAISACILGVVYIFLDQITPLGSSAEASSFVLARAGFMVLIILAYPLYLSVLAQRKQVRLNTYLSIERLLEISALVAVMHFGTETTGLATLASFGWVYLGAMALFYFYLFWKNFAVHPKSRPLFLPISPQQRSEVFRQFKSGLGDILAPLLFFRFDLIFLSILFSPASSILFGLSIQVTGYIRQIGFALVSGLDAVFAKSQFSKTPNEGSESSAKLLISASAYQAIGIFFVSAFVLSNLEPLLRLWLGARLDTMSYDLSDLAKIIFWLIPGIVANAIAQNWAIALTGAGKLPKFVYFLVAISFANPLLMALLIWGGRLDEGSALLGAAFLFSALNLLAYGLVIPRIAAREFNLPLAQLLRPLFLPFAMAVLIYGLVWMLNLGAAPQALLLQAIGFCLAGVLTLRLMRIAPQ